MFRSIAFATIVLSSMYISASASPILVDCNAGQTLTHALAKLDKVTPATVQFTGTCTEFVLIDGFSNLTLRGTQGATIQQPSTTPPASPALVVSIKASRSVTLKGFTVQSLPSAFQSIGIGKGSTDVVVQGVNTAGSWGIEAYETSQVWLVNVNVDVTSGFAAVSAFDKSDVHIVGGTLHRAAVTGFRAGLLVGSGHVTVQGLKIRDFEEGMSIGSSGSVDLVNFQATSASSDVIIENPAGTNVYGAVVDGTASLNISSARLLISNAGQPYGFNSSAIFVTNGSTLNAGAGLVITGSRGQGVMVSNNSHAEFEGASISGSGHGGLVVVNESTAGANLQTPLTSISGNATDLFCDSSSRITGASYIANTTVVQCNSVITGLYESLP